jgi:sugar phosphate isomerase/epimerase
MKFGVSSWTLQWAPPHESVIRRVAASGFRAIELIAWETGDLAAYYTPTKIRELREIAEGENLEISQFVFTPAGLASAERGVRQSAVEAWCKAVEVGAALGAPLINMVSAFPFGFEEGVQYPVFATRLQDQHHTIDLPEGLDWEGNYQAYVDTLWECSAACERANRTATLELHPGRYAANHDGALRLLAAVNSRSLAINFDPSHTFPVGDLPNVSVYRLASNIRHIQVSDNDGVTNVHWRPGSGKIDWRALFKALKATGYDGVVSLEIMTPGASRRPTPYRAGCHVASQSFMDEVIRGKLFLATLCKDLGIAIVE